jgi:predicted MFS family arabinose efflux permease
MSVSGLSPDRRRERLVVFLVGAVQFVNILDFVMVMPLGPDFALKLGIPSSHLGFIGGAYTAAAAVSGLAGSFFLDRFDRRKALAVALLGLGIGTAAGGLATGLGTLMLARVVAGLFGGPATSLSFAIIADVIPVERRGKAMGAVMGAFSVASVLGIPAGLRLAQWWGWRAPFFSVAVLGFIVSSFAIAMLPPMTLHLERNAGAREATMRELLAKPTVQLSYAMTALVMAAGFLVIPNISPFAQINLRFPRHKLDTLYLAGGVVSFFATRLGGWLVDRFGSFKVATLGGAMLLVVLYVWFIDYPTGMHLVVPFMGFMLAMGVRNVAYNTLTSKVPEQHERARFQSLQSAVQHGASAVGAFLSSQLLSVRADGALVGMERVATISMAMSAVFPVMVWVVESRVVSTPKDVLE